jgi:hypothetical protein
MAIVQISRIKQRTGNLVDLPQLSEAEFGWASDQKRLFIGKDTPNENIEVLTSYSTIDFSQIEGSVGNLNISNTVLNGQVLAYDGNNWVNKGGQAGGLITLGNVSNVKITGGAIGYVLETDGLGNLSWAPKGTLYVNIEDLSPDSGNILGFGNDAVIMQVIPTTPFTNGAKVTITGVEGNANANVNSEDFYVQLTSDYPTSGNVVLFTTQDLDPGNVFVDPDIEYDNPNLAIATSIISGGGVSFGVANGTTTMVQYNNNNLLSGDSNFTWDFNNNLLTVVGNASISNITSSGTITGSRLVSTIGTGTAPFSVSSTTLVANLNADLLDGFNTSVASAATTVVVRDANANVLANNVNTNRIFNGTSNVTIASGGNITITVGGTERIRATTTGATITSNLSLGNITATGNINASFITTTANITTNGILTDNYFYANGVPISFSGTYGDANVAAYLPTYTGNISAANITLSSHVIRSVDTAISAAGTVQGDATGLTKDINVISTASAGQGVRLPTAVPGMVIIVNNTSATDINVYPATGAAIGSLATNNPYIHVTNASLQYYAVSPTQWYTVGATYA